MLIATMDIVWAHRKTRHIYIANDSKRASANRKKHFVMYLYRARRKTII